MFALRMLWGSSVDYDAAYVARIILILDRWSVQLAAVWSLLDCYGDDIDFDLNVIHVQGGGSEQNLCKRDWN